MLNEGGFSTVGNAVGALLVLAVFGLAFAQLLAGFVGIQHHLGTAVAVIAVALALSTGFTLPITVGAFFGAMNVWGWHWLSALLFTLPGLAFMALMVPGALSGFLQLTRKP